jgi:hypothetical protein
LLAIDSNLWEIRHSLAHILPKPLEMGQKAGRIHNELKAKGLSRFEPCENSIHAPVKPFQAAGDVRRSAKFRVAGKAGI